MRKIVVGLLLVGLAISIAVAAKDNEPAAKPNETVAMSKKDKSAWADELVKKLKSSDLWVRVEAIKKLGELQDPKAVPSLRQALNDESVDINVEALRALKKIGDVDSLKLLQRGTILYDMQSLRFYALDGAMHIDPDKTKQFLLNNLKSDDKNIRNHATECIGHMVTLTNKIDKESVAQLVTSLKSEKEKNQQEKIVETLNAITGANLPSAEPKEWDDWWDKNNKTMPEVAQPKEVRTDKTPAESTPEEKTKLEEKKKAEEKFDEFKDKNILDKKPDDKDKSYFAGRSEEGKKLTMAAFADNDARPLKLVEDALNWLHRHQEKEGFWSYNGYGKHCPPNQGDDINAIKGEFDVAATGLAVLAFLGAGHTHMPGQKAGLQPGGKYKPTVERALKWLLSIQRADGSFDNPQRKGQKTNMFEQAMATLAISEAYGMTGDSSLKDPAQRAVGFISKSKNPGKGWRYTPNCGDNDTSLVGWQVFAVKSAKVSGLNTERDDFADASQWLDDMTDMETAQVGYNKKASGSTTITSIGIICRMLLGWRSDSPLLQKGADLVIADASFMGNPQNFYHIYQTALAMFQMGGRHWTEWNRQMTDFLAGTAVGEGCEHGSWPATDEKWSKSRVYTTALGALSLEVYYRYLPFAR